MIWDFLDPKKGTEETQSKRELDTTTTAAPEKSVNTATDPQECDYERNCTPLYGCIEAAVKDADWDPIVKFLDTGYWPKSGLFADTLTPTQQARTWVTRFDPDDSSKVRWSQLPLHLAIVCGAPFSVVGRLIELYPQAVRCTDDQRMLPLHLSLRHNASDDVVAYLLMQFPESVNAKGKDGRLPIQCALRANSKVRGKILEIFVKKTKTKHKVAMGGGNTQEKEISLLKTNLEAKTLALDNAESKLEALDRFKAEVETELKNRTLQLEEFKTANDKVSVESLQELEDKHLVEVLALQKKIEQLEEEKNAAVNAERRAMGIEESLREELDNVTQAVSVASPNELGELKREVTVMQEQRLETARVDAQEQIHALRTDLEKNMSGSVDSKADKELKSMQHMVNELHKAANDTRTDDELKSLRSEVQSLRNELKDREMATRTKTDLEDLKVSLESELKNSEGKTQEELKALKAAIRSMNVNEMETKTTEELATLKKEIETVKKQLQENELATKTQKDVILLKGSLERELKEAKGATFKELATTKRTLDAIQEDLERGRSKEDILVLRKEVDILKTQVKEKEQSTRLRSEMIQLKEELENEIKNSEGKTRSELAELKKAVRSVDDKQMRSLNIEELSAHKGELEVIKAKIDQKEDATKAKEEIMEMKRSLDTNVKSWKGKNRDNITVLIKEADQKMDAVEQLSVGKVDTSDDIRSIKDELSKLREDVKVAEDATKTKEELESLKVTLEEALKTSEGTTTDELIAMKAAVDSINVEHLEIKNKEEWALIRSELAALKDDLKTKEAGEGLLKREIAELKAQMPRDQKQKKTRGWKKVLSRFRRKDSSGSSVSTPQIRNSQDEDDVVTISPPSVHPGSVPENVSEDDEGMPSKTSMTTRSVKTAPANIAGRDVPVDDEQSNQSKRSTFSFRSTRSTKSASSKASRRSYQQASKAAISAAQVAKKGINVDAETGETIFNGEEKKVEDEIRTGA